MFARMATVQRGVSRCRSGGRRKIDPPLSALAEGVPRGSDGGAVAAADPHQISRAVVGAAEAVPQHPQHPGRGRREQRSAWAGGRSSSSQNNLRATRVGPTKRGLARSISAQASSGSIAQASGTVSASWPMTGSSAAARSRTAARAAVRVIGARFQVDAACRRAAAGSARPACARRGSVGQVGHVRSIRQHSRPQGFVLQPVQGLQLVEHEAGVFDQRGPPDRRHRIGKHNDQPVQIPPDRTVNGGAGDGDVVRAGRNCHR